MILEVTILTVVTLNLGIQLYNHIIINSKCFNIVNKNGNNSMDNQKNVE